MNHYDSSDPKKFKPKLKCKEVNMIIGDENEERKKHMKNALQRVKYAFGI